FVTQKENPKDIDLVTFLDHEVYAKREKQGKLDKFWSFSLEDEGIDAYLVRDYPPNHSNAEETKAFRKEWIDRYKRAFPFDKSKGFLEIIFEK
ncbi:MAG: hypothetical protein AAGJ18_09660, partial [Bacteroidota bacterium]